MKNYLVCFVVLLMSGCAITPYGVYPVPVDYPHTHHHMHPHPYDTRGIYPYSHQYRYFNRGYR